MTYDPTAIRVVPHDLLVQLSAEGTPASPTKEPAHQTITSSPKGRYRSRLLVDRWLSDCGVEFRVKSAPEGRGRTVYVLKECPFDTTHGDPDSCIMQDPDGKMSANCFHNGCKERGWQEFKAIIGPPESQHYDPPLTRSRRTGTNQNAGSQGSSASPPPLDGEGDDPPFRDTDAGRSTRPTIAIEPETTPVADTMCAISDRLLASGDCFRRADQLVRVTGPTITPILSAAELAGLLNHHVEFQFIKGKESGYKPLPTNYSNTWLNHPGETARLPAITLFTLNPVFTTDWRLATSGYDAGSGIYNAGPTVEARNTTEHLDALLKDFCFRTRCDRTNYVGMLLTAILIPRFIGSKPTVLFNGNQPGLGKSILAQIIAILRDGRPTETATYNPNDEEFEKRLGAIVRRGATTIIIDNANAGWRNPRIDSACLERSITDAVLSFRLLGYSREIRAENSHIYCITANTPDVSRDLVTRSVVVGLFHEGDPVKRTFTIPDPEGYAEDHRVELLGELVGMIERWGAAGRPMASVNSRFNKKGWGAIVGGILAHAGFPDFLANAESTAIELDETRQEFAYLVELIADHPQGFWTPGELAEFAHSQGLFSNDFGEASPHARSVRFGLIAGRHIGVQFPLRNGRIAVFQRSEERKGNIYRVTVHHPDDER
jgi:hypothetical protein